MNLPLLAMNFFVLVSCLTFHEAAHAWTAYRFGDDTAARLGRMSLNPLVHLNPLGTLMILSGMPLGWAKPVPVNGSNLRNPHAHMQLVSFAGPLSNLALGLFFCLVYFFIGHRLFPGSGWYLLLLLFIKINFSLAIFNLLPVSPLDGANVITAFMSREAARSYEEKTARLGPFPLVFIVLFEMMPGPGPIELWFRLWNPLFTPILGLFNVPPWYLPYYSPH